LGRGREVIRQIDGVEPRSPRRALGLSSASTCAKSEPWRPSSCVEAARSLLRVHPIRPHPGMRDRCPQRLAFDANAEVYESNRLAWWYRAQSDHLLEHLSLGRTRRGHRTADDGDRASEVCPLRQRLSVSSGTGVRGPRQPRPIGRAADSRPDQGARISPSFVSMCVASCCAIAYTLQHLGRGRQHARAGGIQEVWVVAQLRRVLSKNKLCTGVAVVVGTTLSAPPMPTAWPR
jgi:hypothetical protein